MRPFNFRGRFTVEAKGMALAWHIEGLSVRTIARRLRLSHSTVLRYLSAKASLSTTSPITSAPRTHSPPHPLKSVVVRRRLVKRLALLLSSERPGSRKYPSTYAIARQCNLQGVPVSVSTVRRDLIELGFVLRCRRRAVAFHDGDAHARLQFARTCKDTDVLFSDEKVFDTNDHGCRTEWCYQGQHASVRETARWAPRLHIWGLIGIGVKKLVVLPEGSITKEKYKYHCLQRVVVPTMEALRAEGRTPVFMQDGARAHTANTNLTYLSSKDIFPLQWPARSPDLNPIENFWAHVQREVSIRGPTDENELRAFVLRVWNDIPQSAVDAYVLSFQQRLKECVRMQGERLPV